MEKLSKYNNIGITGGTGSFGSTFLKRMLAEYRHVKFFILSRDETKQEILRRELNNDNVKFIIGDIRDKDSLYSFCKSVDVIFHAAAMKYVPSCEFNPFQATLTNVIGSNNLINVANEVGVKKIVLLSTDKAVEPINAMGISKALMEKIGVSKAFDSTCNTKICITRYGNVLGSRGSVIPFFYERLKKGLPITVTNADMTRFVMSLDESVDLVVHALDNGITGEIFVQKSPAASVYTIVEAMGVLLSVEPEITYIGERHGEKLHEVLISSDEMNRVTESDKYYTISPDLRDENYNKYRNNVKVNKNINYSSFNTNQLDKYQLAEYIVKLDFWEKLRNS
jgi:UDP-glucose 4-epimerase